MNFATFDRAFSTQPETFTVGFVGTLKPWHGLPILTAAFAQLHQQVPNTTNNYWQTSRHIFINF